MNEATFAVNNGHGEVLKRLHVCETSGQLREYIERLRKRAGVQNARTAEERRCWVQSAIQDSSTHVNGHRADPRTVQVEVESGHVTVVVRDIDFDARPVEVVGI